MHEASLVIRSDRMLTIRQGGGYGDPRIDDLAIRLLDIAVALVALILFLPLMLIIAALIFVTDPGPVIYAQRRVGYAGRKFKCLKFRSMVVDSHERLAELLASDPQLRAEWDRDHKLRDDPRITPVGRFLRKSSLDELPQLFNVLAGQMSIVGPRPIIDAEIYRYGQRFAHYCSVRPGITGLWQISGRSNVSYRRRVALDVTYVRSRSVWLNLKIISLTVPSVMLVRGAC